MKYHVFSTIIGKIMKNNLSSIYEEKMNFTHCSLALVALLSANALADISLNAGEWESESVLLVDGVKLSGANGIERQIPESATPVQREVYEAISEQDSEPDTSKSYHCNGKPVPVLKPEDYAYTVLKDGTGDEWDCSLGARNNPQFDHSFNFSCTSPLGAKSDGEINFLHREKSYKTEIYSKSHMTDPATGRPLSPKLISSHLTINGRWLSDKCVHSSVEESDSEE